MTKEEFIESVRLEGEEWRDVLGYESQYIVSNLGRVATITTLVKDKLRDRVRKPRLLSPSSHTCNGIKYYHVALTRNGKTTHHKVHRLVAQAFIPNPNNLTEIDHIDTNGLNNHYLNLRWVSHKENLNNSYTTAKMSNTRTGKPCPFNWKPIVQTLNGVLIRKYRNITSVKDFGFSPAGVSNNVSGKSKSSGGYKWMYLEDYENSVSMSKNS